ncbi:MAG: NADH-quinone oxidoreductase subunit I [archaeon]|nr:NADH-quinone oxidoreductase subunit I [archaeon]MCP8305788.1 NADH-quinone oxidoreductase subunit I [archaeon]
MVLSILRPFFLGLYHVFKRTFTVKHPYETLKPPERHRGRVMLNMDRCIGCNSCVNICPNKALTLVEFNGRKLPQYNAGRCCFCVLCVDICPVLALSMTHEVEYSVYKKEDHIYPPDRFSQPPEPIKGKIVTVKTLDKKFGVKHG